MGLESYFYTSMCQRCEFMGLSCIRQKVTSRQGLFALQSDKKDSKGWGFNEGSGPLDHAPK